MCACAGMRKIERAHARQREREVTERERERKREREREREGLCVCVCWRILAYVSVNGLGQRRGSTTGEGAGFCP